MHKKSSNFCFYQCNRDHEFQAPAIPQSLAEFTIKKTKHSCYLILYYYFIILLLLSLEIRDYGNDHMRTWHDGGAWHSGVAGQPWIGHVLDEDGAACPAPSVSVRCARRAGRGRERSARGVERGGASRGVIGVISAGCERVHATSSSCYSTSVRWCTYERPRA